MEASKVPEVLGSEKGFAMEKTAGDSGTRRVTWFAAYGVVLDDAHRVKIVIARDGSWELHRKGR
jgi:hypothetical protein